MPRSGAGVYTKPNAAVVPNTTIASSEYNSTIDDLVSDANTPRPLSAGGTAGTSASTARTALGVAEAATSVTDTTEGRGLIMGSLGWGGIAIAATDLDDAVGVTALYRTNGGSTLNMPIDSSGVCLNLARASDIDTQLYARHSVNEQHIRQRTAADTWTDWQQLVTLVERTEPDNNGWCERFSDGRMIAYLNYSATVAINASFATGGCYRSASQTWNWPTAFVDTPLVFANSTLLTALGVTIGYVNEIGATWAWTAVTSQSSDARSANLVAMGYWE